MLLNNEEFEYLKKASRMFYEEIGQDYNDLQDEIYKQLLENPMVVIKVIIGKGFIVGFEAPSFLDPLKKTLSEVAWFVEPKYRGTSTSIKLLKAFEKEGKKRNCDDVIMVCLEKLEPKKIGKIYERMGYNIIEHNYKKDL